MPRFPYTPDVNTDLRTLFRKDREGRTSRHLGLSSITRGEGSMDLYETDDGPVVGRYGDLPDGGFGVGFVHRGAFWNVSDLIGQGQDHDDAQDGRLDNHANRIISAEGRLGTAEGRLDNHATRITGAEGQLDDHAGRIGATESKNTQQDGRLDNHAGRIGAVEGDAGSLDSRIGSAEGRLDSHASRIGAAEGVNSTQNGRLDSHVSRIGALEVDIQRVETKIDVMDGRLRNWIANARESVPELPPWPGS